VQSPEFVSVSDTLKVQLQSVMREPKPSQALVAHPTALAHFWRLRREILVESAVTLHFLLVSTDIEPFSIFAHFTGLSMQPCENLGLESSGWGLPHGPSSSPGCLRLLHSRSGGGEGGGLFQEHHVIGHTDQFGFNN